MPKVFHANAVAMNTPTTGAGTLTVNTVLDAAHITAAQAGVVDGQTYSYKITDGNDIEFGNTVAGGAATTFTRVLKFSKIGGVYSTVNKITLSGSAIFRIIEAAEDIDAKANEPLFVFEGDSLTNISNVGTWPTKLTAQNAFFGRGKSICFAADGDIAANMISEYATQAGAVSSLGPGVEAYYFLWAGTNDIGIGTSASTTYGYLTTIWAAARASGYKVVALTIKPSGTYTAAGALAAVELNRLILSDRSLYDFVVRVDALLPDYSDTVNFLADTIHLTSAGNVLVAQEVARVVLGVGPAYAAPVEAMTYSGMQLNGGMELNQDPGPGTTTLVSGVAKFIIDAWKLSYTHAANTAVFTATQIAASSFPAPLNGYKFGLQLKSTTAFSAPAAGDSVLFIQRIEGNRAARLAWGATGAKPLSYAFHFYSTASGVGFVRIRNKTSTRIFYQEFTVAAGWNYIQNTIPGCVDGVWETGNIIGVNFDIYLAGVAASPAVPGNWVTAVGGQNQTTNSTNLFASNNNTCILTGLFVIPGIYLPGAARLPLLVRPYDQELLSCARQLWVVNADGFVATGQAYTTTAAALVLPLPVPLCAAPTAVTLSAAADWSLTDAASAAKAVTALSAAVGFAGQNTIQLNMSVASGLVAGNATTLSRSVSGTGKIIVDSRL